MSTLMDDEIKRWTARRKSALVLELIQGHGGRGQPGLRPAAFGDREVDGGRQAGMENALRTNPQDLREEYEKQLKELQEAYGEAMLELRVRKKLQSLLGEDEK